MGELPVYLCIQYIYEFVTNARTTDITHLNTNTQTMLLMGILAISISINGYMWALFPLWIITYRNVFPYVINLFEPSNDTSSTEWWFELLPPLIIGFFVYGGSYFIRVVFLLFAICFVINKNMRMKREEKTKTFFFCLAH